MTACLLGNYILTSKEYIFVVPAESVPPARCYQNFSRDLTCEQGETGVYYEHIVAQPLSIGEPKSNCIRVKTRTFNTRK